MNEARKHGRREAVLLDHRTISNRTWKDEPRPEGEKRDASSVASWYFRRGHNTDPGGPSFQGQFRWNGSRLHAPTELTDPARRAVDGNLVVVLELVIGDEFGFPSGALCGARAALDAD